MSETQNIVKIVLSYFGNRDVKEFTGVDFQLIIDGESRKPKYMTYINEKGETKNVGLASCKRIELSPIKIKMNKKDYLSVVKIGNFLQKKIQEIMDDPKVLDDA